MSCRRHFTFCAWLSAAAMLFACQTVVAQPPGRGPGFGGGGLEILFSPEVRADLDLVEEQEQQIQALWGQMGDKMRSAFAGIQDLPPEERRDAIMSRMREQQKNMEQELGQILLDHQLERLRQLQLQSRLQSGNTADALATDEIREKLGLTDAQIDQMRELAREAEAELREKIQKATEEARAKVLSVLTPQQQAQWKSLVGETFSFQNRGFGGGRPGGNGGPGGARRGGPPRE